MIIDARKLPSQTTLKADICIVGGGAAGITLASQFQEQQVHVCLIESGGLHRDRQTERLNSAENSGTYKVDVSFLRRYFGGATNMWGGNSAPYDAVDFAERPYAPSAQWPIPRSELEIYYPRAQAFCQLESANFEPSFWKQNSKTFKAQSVPITGNLLTPKVFQRRTVRFRKIYQDIISKSNSNITALMNATVLRLESRANGKSVQAAHVGSINGKQAKVEAKVFILAAGNENARVLLLSRDVQKKGLGNQYDTVGRYLMRHLNVVSGVFVEKRPFRDFSLYQLLTYAIRKGRDQTALFAGFQISEQEQKRSQILNYVAFLEPIYHLSPNAESHLYDQAWMKRWQGGKKRPFFYGRFAAWLTDQSSSRMYAIRNWVEQAPDRENRIRLSQAKDVLGLPKLQFQWGIGRREKMTLLKSQEILNQEFQRMGFGAVYVDLPSLSDLWPDYLARAAHFMGTTRMSRSPKEGVVDGDCKVHDIENLYIAGGSVLPVGGASMVTYNLIALAIRLADHLKQKMSGKETTRS